MLPDQSVGTTQVVHAEIAGAVRVLPNQVSAIGDTRDLLTARNVPASAFGDVDSSAQVGAAHADNVATAGRGLENASGRLTDIINKVHGTGEAVGEFDQRQAKSQQEQNLMLAQVVPDRQRQAPTGPTVTLPNGTVFQPKPGETHIVPLGTDIQLNDGSRMTPNNQGAHWERSDDTHVKRVPVDELPMW
jgi:hypothetical protein